MLEESSPRVIFEQQQGVVSQPSLGAAG
jgi:hypothetical protein